jgi:hypothetical protein
MRAFFSAGRVGVISGPSILLQPIVLKNHMPVHRRTNTMRILT